MSTQMLAAWMLVAVMAADPEPAPTPPAEVHEIWWIDVLHVGEHQHWVIFWDLDVSVWSRTGKKELFSRGFHTISLETSYDPETMTRTDLGVPKFAWPHEENGKFVYRFEKNGKRYEVWSRKLTYSWYDFDYESLLKGAGVPCRPICWP